MCRLGFYALALLLLLPAQTALAADKRVALVIGNAAYKHTSELANPRNDAADMARALETAGFHVISGLDLDKAGFERKIREFAMALSGAEVGLFFYAGHGLQVGGQNYLVPTDAELMTSSALEFEMVRLDAVHRIMEREAQTNILFLDACRNNPLARNLARAMGTRAPDIGRGLAAVEGGIGTLISFSTQPGNVALDGSGRNSPFTAALVKHISASNDDLSALLIAVRNDVMKETQRRQVPWEHSALTGRFYFSAAGSAQPPSRPTVAQAAQSHTSEAERAWQLVRDSANQAVLESYVQQFAGTVYAALAQARIDELRKRQAAVIVPQPPNTAKSVTPAVGLRSDCKEIEIEVGDARQCLKPKDAFRDCADCPEMVVIPAGEFMMGSPETEQGRWSDGREGPLHKVTIRRAFAVGKTGITRGEFAAFVKDSGYSIADGCSSFDGQKWTRAPNASWRSPGFPGFEQDDRHPVVCVTWEQANAYAQWLSKKTGKTYRLLSEAEREYATRAATTAAASQPPFHFGSDASELCKYGNGQDLSAKFSWKNTSCSDGYPYTAPVASFQPNAFGLYDMHGNVWEWAADCWNERYHGAPADGSPWLAGNCDSRVQRGGTWTDQPALLRSASRIGGRVQGRSFHVGFRIARTL